MRYSSFSFQEFPDQNVVHGVQRLQIRGRRGEQSTRNRALHPNRVGDHASGGLRREPLYGWQRTTWQGFLYVRLQLCPEVSVCSLSLEIIQSTFPFLTPYPFPKLVSINFGEEIKTDIIFRLVDKFYSHYLAIITISKLVSTFSRVILKKKLDRIFVRKRIVLEKLKCNVIRLRFWLSLKLRTRIKRPELFSKMSP